MRTSCHTRARRTCTPSEEPSHIAVRLRSDTKTFICRMPASIFTFETRPPCCVVVLPDQGTRNVCYSVGAFRCQAVIVQERHQEEVSGCCRAQCVRARQRRGRQGRRCRAAGIHLPNWTLQIVLHLSLQQIGQHRPFSPATVPPRSRHANHLQRALARHHMWRLGQPRQGKCVEKGARTLAVTRKLLQAARRKRPSA
jgi:hypothetical protein